MASPWYEAFVVLILQLRGIIVYVGRTSNLLGKGRKLNGFVCRLTINHQLETNNEEVE